MKICLYGASSPDLAQEYYDRVFELGVEMAGRGHGMVYGGGAQGIMGAAARGVRSKDGEVVGVAPNFFNVDGILYQNCTEFVYTETMRQRKQIMEERADAFVLAPGGIGSFEEFFEILTLKQLGRHNKPIAVLNTRGYYDSLQRMMEHAVEEGFVKEACLGIYRVFEEPGELLDYLETYDPEVLDVRHLKNI